MHRSMDKLQRDSAMLMYDSFTNHDRKSVESQSKNNDKFSIQIKMMTDQGSRDGRKNSSMGHLSVPSKNGRKSV